MVREDLKSAERDELVKKHGYKAHGLPRMIIAFMIAGTK